MLFAYFTPFILEAPRAAVAAISQESDELVEAWHLPGAGLLLNIGKFVLPQGAHGLLAGWVILFFLSANEVTTHLLLGGLSNSIVRQVKIDYSANRRLSEICGMTLIVTLVYVLVVLLASGATSCGYRATSRS